MLLVRLRSIGDTVLMTPCMTALKRWRPEIHVDVALEPFCAPLLEHHPDVRRVVSVNRSTAGRLLSAAGLARTGYDLAVNLNGGSTAALLAIASRAPVRVGFAGYRFPWLANCRVTSSHDVWKRTNVHTVEHQLALIAGMGVPVDEVPPTSLRCDDGAMQRVLGRLATRSIPVEAFAVLHAEASLPAKRWPAVRFAELATRLLRQRGLHAVVIGQDAGIVARAAGPDGVPMADLTLAETMALIARSSLFVGNDSGPAHIAAAFGRPLVVIFGPSNVELWRPWTLGPWRAVSGESARAVLPEEVDTAVEAVLREACR